LDSRDIGLDNENIDYASFLYIPALLCLLEEKIGFKNFPRFAQCDTHSVIDQMCQFASTHPDFRAKRLKQGRTEKITYRGYHLVQFEKTNPEDGKIRLNGMTITKEQLVLFLQGKWEPVIQYEHLQKHQALLLDIMDCETEEDLTEIKDRIVSTILPTIDPNGPEKALLQKVFTEQRRKVKDALHNRINKAISDIGEIS
jgi:hypothetical protein